MKFDAEEIVTLHGQGKMTLRTAVERVLTRNPQTESVPTTLTERMVAEKSKRAIAKFW
jgi:hypothetical protein